MAGKVPGIEQLLEGKPPLGDTLQAAHDVAAARAMLEDPSVAESSLISRGLVAATTALSDLRAGHIFDTDGSGRQEASPLSQYVLYPGAGGSEVRARLIEETPRTKPTEEVTTTEVVEETEVTRDEPFEADFCYVRLENDDGSQFTGHQGLGTVGVQDMLGLGISLWFSNRPRIIFERRLTGVEMKNHKPFTYTDLILPIGQLGTWRVHEFRTLTGTDGVPLKEVSRWAEGQAVAATGRSRKQLRI